MIPDDKVPPSFGIRLPRTLRRCSWADGDPLLATYHDEEWGVPIHDDRHWYEKLTLDGAQAGLSWLTILRKRDGYRARSATSIPRRWPASASATSPA